MVLRYGMRHNPQVAALQDKLRTFDALLKQNGKDGFLSDSDLYAFDKGRGNYFDVTQKSVEHVQQIGLDAKLLKSADDVDGIYGTDSTRTLDTLIAREKATAALATPKQQDKKAASSPKHSHEEARTQPLRRDRREGLFDPENPEVITASWYGKKSQGKPTGDGKGHFDYHDYTAASLSYPFGSIVKVEYGGNAMLALINDSGPYIRGRQLDLSLHLAEKLSEGLPKEESFLHHGINQVKVTYLGNANDNPELYKQWAEQAGRPNHESAVADTMRAEMEATGHGLNTSLKKSSTFERT